jgi:hypothetical protein
MVHIQKPSQILILNGLIQREHPPVGAVAQHLIPWSLARRLRHRAIKPS